MVQPTTVSVLANPEEILAAALAEFDQALEAMADPLVSFATGETFKALFGRLRERFEEGSLDARSFRGTHLDEYEGFGIERVGGMMAQLLVACPPFRSMLEEGRFLPVPSDASGIAAYREAVRVAGGVRLQFLGIGRNGHLAFNEPGSEFSSVLRRAELTDETRAVARGTFASETVPRWAITSGTHDILSAHRLVLVATGAAKAEAVKKAIEGPIDPACPASAIRMHPNGIFLLDHAAASLLKSSGLEEQGRQACS